MWKLLDYIKMPNTQNVYSILMARQWYMQAGQPMPHWQHPKPRQARVSPSGQKRARSR